jgi:hypothetical protein
MDLKQSVSFVWRVQDKITENPTCYLLKTVACNLNLFQEKRIGQKRNVFLENLKQQFGAFI